MIEGRSPSEVAAEAASSPGLYTDVHDYDDVLRYPTGPTVQINNDDGSLFNKDRLLKEFRAARGDFVMIKKKNKNIDMRGFVEKLLEKLPESTCPNLRTLILIMLVIPASSAQSERDFSAQVRSIVCFCSHNACVTSIYAHVQNKIKVKGRASLSIDSLDHLLRVYSLPHSLFYEWLEGEEFNEAQEKAMKIDVVAHLMRDDLCDLESIKKVWDEQRRAPAATAAASAGVITSTDA
eukprot:COSAG06_NODE_17_length_34906_cov_31.908268_43_plen_236_part_00